MPRAVFGALGLYGIASYGLGLTSRGTKSIFWPPSSITGSPIGLFLEMESLNIESTSPFLDIRCSLAYLIVSILLWGLMTLELISGTESWLPISDCLGDLNVWAYYEFLLEKNSSGMLVLSLAVPNWVLACEFPKSSYSLININFRILVGVLELTWANYTGLILLEFYLLEIDASFWGESIEIVKQIK